MSAYGVLCRCADGEQALVEVEAPDAANARQQVVDRVRLFYGPGDAAGRWLASRNPQTTVVSVGEVREMVAWETSSD